MRIAYVHSDRDTPLFGGSRTAIEVEDTVRALRDLGHDVVAHVTAVGGGPRGDLSDLEVVDHGRAPAHGSADRERAAVAADDTVEARVVADEDVDLVHERYTAWGGGGVRAARRTSRPALLEVAAPAFDTHGVPGVVFDRVAAECRAHRAIAAASAVSCASEALAAWVRARTPSSQHVHVVGAGVDTERFRPGDDRAPDAFTVGLVGTHGVGLDTDVLVGALSRLRVAIPAVRLLVIAGEEGAATARELAARLAVPVTHARIRTYAEVPALLHRLDAGAVPWSEVDEAGHPSPRSLHELLAVGVPTVATAVGETADVLEHGRAGLVVPSGDERAFAQALRTIATRPAIARRLRRRARTLAVTRYTASRARQRAIALTLEAARDDPRSAVA